MAELIYPFVGHKPDAEVIVWAKDLLTDEGDTEALAELDAMPEAEAVHFAMTILMDAGVATFTRACYKP